MPQFNIAEAKAPFSELVEKALAGDEIVVARDNKPLLKLVPLGGPGQPRVPGSARGKVRMARNFDERLPDFEPYE